MVDLEHLDPPVWDLPPAHAVRRRGERAARRRHVTLGVAGALAAAAIGVPLATADPRVPAQPPVAVDRPSAPAPAAVDLIAGMAGAAEVAATPSDLRDATRCVIGRWVADVAGAADVRLAVGPGEQRLLARYRDVGDAREAFRRARDTSRPCERSGGSELVLLDPEGADDTWALVLDDRESVVVVRVGVALLLDHAEGGVAGVEDRIAPIVEELR